MDSKKQMYDYFAAQGELTDSNFRDLIRMCGFTPNEKQITKIPKNYNEFIECLTLFEKKSNKDHIYEQMFSLCGGNTITRDEIIKLLSKDNKLNDEEILTFLKSIKSENEIYNIKDFVESIYNDK